MDKKSAGLLAEFQAGTCMFAGQLLGCHRLTGRNRRGYAFRLWAPGVKGAWVAGEFTGGEPAVMSPAGGGVWELFSPLPQEGMAYRFQVLLPDGQRIWIADPCASRAGPDNTALVHAGQPFAWTDSRWMREFPQREHLTAPMHIWGLDYRPDLQPPRPEMGCTHVELGGLITPETPFALPAALGPPEALKTWINALHRAGVGVLGRWPAAMCLGLPRPAGGAGAPPQEKSLLLSCAAHWLEEYHLDGLRVETPENPGRPVRDVLLAVNRAADRVRPNAVLISGGTPGVSPPGDFLLRWRPDWATDGAGWLGRDLLPAPPLGDSPRDRATLALMMALPGKKYTAGQSTAFAQALNQFYLSHCQLWQDETGGYRPVLHQGDVLVFRRLDRRARELLVVCNFGPQGRENFSLPVPRRGIYRPAFHTGPVPPPPAEGRKWGGGYAAEFSLPPESVTFYLRSNPPRQKA